MTGLSIPYGPFALALSRLYFYGVAEMRAGVFVNIFASLAIFLTPVLNAGQQGIFLNEAGVKLGPAL